MELDRRSLLAAGLATGIAPNLATRARAQTASPVVIGGMPPALPDPPETIDLWPASQMQVTPPAARFETVNERSTDPTYNDRAVFGISVPRMAVFRPITPNGAAVLITPGGGYKWVVIDKEGYEMARLLAAGGFTVFVLFYRLPGEGWASGPDTPLIDAQRAMRLIRHRASEFKIDPERIAAMGFSAGGHVCASLSTRFAAPVYAPVDAADGLSARPHSAAPIYPVVSMAPVIAHAGSRALLLGPNPSAALEAAYSPDRTVPTDAPPHFLLHAEDDAAVPVANTLRLREALLARKIPLEMHLFAQGGHGFGLRLAKGKPVAIWPELWLAWVKTVGLA
jgi:acetyl esterase/lipase